jgi:hypothetical protein
MNEIVEIGLFFLLSGVKYLFAVGLLLANSSREWYLDMLIAASGGTLGVFVFTYLGAFVSAYFSRFHFFKIKYKKLKKFMKIKNSFGLMGLALISPMFISIPVGCIISAAFEHNKPKIIRHQLFAVLFWSILLFGLKGLFGINIGKSL